MLTSPETALCRCVQCGFLHSPAQHRIVNPETGERSAACRFCDPEPHVIPMSVLVRNSGNFRKPENFTPRLFRWEGGELR